MSRVTMLTVGNSFSASYSTSVNTNFSNISDVLDRLLSRDLDAEPNTIVDDIDMNSQRLTNLPAATNNQEPCTWLQANDLIAGIPSHVTSTAEGWKIDRAYIDTSFRLIMEYTDIGTGTEVLQVGGQGLATYKTTYFYVQDADTTATISDPPDSGDNPTCSYVLNDAAGNWIGDLSYYSDGTLNLTNWIVGGDTFIQGCYDYNGGWLVDNLLYYDGTARTLRWGLDYLFDATVNVGAGSDDHVLTYDHSTGLIGLEASSVGSGVATVNTQNGSYTFVAGDANNIVQKASGGAGETYTIPANASVAYAIGTLIAITNDGGGDLTVAITTDVLEGTDGATGSRTLSDNNSATIEKMTATKWRYSSTDIGGGGTPEYASFYCTTPGNTNVTTTETQATLDSTLLTSDGAIFVLSSDTVTVNKTAHFKITYDVSISQDSDTGDARSTIDIWLDNATTEIAGSRTSFYTRGFSTASSGSGTLITALTSGATISLRWQAAGGADYDEVANAIRLTFEEMA